MDTYVILYMREMVTLLGQLNVGKQMEDLEVTEKNNIRADLEEIWSVNRLQLRSFLE